MQRRVAMKAITGILANRDFISSLEAYDFMDHSATYSSLYDTNMMTFDNSKEISVKQSTFSDILCYVYSTINSSISSGNKLKILHLSYNHLIINLIYLLMLITQNALTVRWIGFNQIYAFKKNGV